MAAVDTSAPAEQAARTRAGPLGWLTDEWGDLTAHYREPLPALSDHFDLVRAGHFTTTPRQKQALTVWTRTVTRWHWFWAWAALHPGRYATARTIQWLLLAEGLSRVPVVGRIVPDQLLIEWWIGQALPYWRVILASLGTALLAVLLVLGLIWRLREGYERKREAEREARTRFVHLDVEHGAARPTVVDLTDGSFDGGEG